MCDGWAMSTLSWGAKRSILQAPVVDDRGRYYKEVGARLPVTPAQGQQAEHLNGFAETHVIGQAAAELEAAQRPEPLHAELLVGT